MKKLTSTLIGFALVLAITGCKSTIPTITPALVQQGVTTLVQYGVQKEPAAKPGVQAAALVICSAANGTNLSPSQVVADIGKINPSLNTPTAVLIENSALTLYVGVWESYGADAVNRSPQLKLYLQATCVGMNAGLGNTAAIRSTENPWPLIRQ
jgi:hypothetical protein